MRELVQVPEWFVRAALLCIGIVIGVLLAHAGYWLGRADAMDELDGPQASTRYMPGHMQ